MKRSLVRAAKGAMSLLPHGVQLVQTQHRVPNRILGWL